MQTETQSSRRRMDNRDKKARQTTVQSEPSKRLNFMSALFLIEAIFIVLLYNFIGLIAVLIFAAIPFIYFLLSYRANKKGKKKIKGSTLVLIIYLIIILLGIRAQGVLGSLVSNSQTNEFYVLARTDDAANKMEDIASGSSIALGTEDNYNTNIFPRAKFEEEGFEFNYITTSNEVDRVGSLIDGSYDYVVVQDYKDSKFKENFDNYKKDTKVIGHYKETVSIKTGDKKVTKEKFTVLLTGTDTRSDLIDSNSRSDSIMVATVDPKTSTASLVSIPRDAYVESTCVGGYDKITHSSLNGMDCLISDVENLLDVEIDYYLKVNFFTVIDAIDAVGGIDIEVEETFCGQDENDNLNAYCFSPGTTTMSGSEALSYARERHSFSDGDYSRAKHQQQVLEGFMKALMTSGPLAINNLLDVASSSARTNLTASQLTDLAKLVQKSDGLNIDSMTIDGYGQYADLPYWGLYGTSVQVLDETSVNEAKTMLGSI